MTAWHIICTRPGDSVFVAKELSPYRGFSPLYEVTVLTRHLQKIKRAIPVFPRYTFAFWDGDDYSLWHLIRDIPGVTGILGGENPTSVRSSEIEGWIEKADENWIVPDLEPVMAAARIGLNVHVKIKRGAWEGHHGITESFDDKKLLVGVKTALFGRPLTIYLAPSWCDVVSDEASNSLVGLRPRRDRRKRRRQHSKIQLSP